MSAEQKLLKRLHIQQVFNSVNILDAVCEYAMAKKNRKGKQKKKVVRVKAKPKIKQITGKKEEGKTGKINK